MKKELINKKEKEFSLIKYWKWIIIFALIFLFWIIIIILYAFINNIDTILLFASSTFSNIIIVIGLFLFNLINNEKQNKFQKDIMESFESSLLKIADHIEKISISFEEIVKVKSNISKDKSMFEN